MERFEGSLKTYMERAARFGEHVFIARQPKSITAKGRTEKGFRDVIAPIFNTGAVPYSPYSSTPERVDIAALEVE